MIISVFDRVEKILGKGEIASTNNSSFSHYVFKRLFSPDPSKGVIVWEWVKHYLTLQPINLLDFKVPNKNLAFA